MSFRLFRYPVTIQPTVWFVLGFLVLVRAAEGPQALLAGATFAAIVFGSILVHELGHATVGDRLGLGPCAITLHGFGGLTSFSRPPGPRQGLLVTLAGPGAGLTLGGVAAVLLFLAPMDAPAVQRALLTLALVNVIWSLFNLLPMVPLDGGMVMIHGLRTLGLPPARVLRVARVVSVAVAVAVGAAAIALNQWFVAVVVALVLFRNLRP